MKSHFLLLFTSITLLILLCSCSNIPKPPNTVRSVEELDQYINKVIESGTPPGMSLIIVKNGQIVYNKGFGWADKPKKIHATPETVYHWWSCTKIATAIAILQLQEKGKLNINDPVINYLPFFKVQYPSDSSKHVTILNLLNHSSGLPDPSPFTFVNWIHHDDEPPINQTELIKRVLPKYSTLKFEPGEQAAYTNIGYMLLGAIIEKVTGLAYEEYIRQNILQPLGMTHTDFQYTKTMEENEAAGAHPILSWWTPMIPFICGTYIRNFGGGHIWIKRVYTDQTPSTALIGSTADAARLTIAYLNKGELDGQRILSKESIASMNYEGQIKNKNEDSLNYFRQGIGWQIYGKSGRWVVTHEGGSLGFCTKIQLYPDENLGLILFTNDVSSVDWNRKIINLAASLKW